MRPAPGHRAGASYPAASVHPNAGSEQSRFAAAALTPLPADRQVPRRSVVSRGILCAVRLTYCSGCTWWTVTPTPPDRDCCVVCQRRLVTRRVRSARQGRAVVVRLRRIAAAPPVPAETARAERRRAVAGLRDAAFGAERAYLRLLCAALRVAATSWASVRSKRAAAALRSSAELWLVASVLRGPAGGAVDVVYVRRSLAQKRAWASGPMRASCERAWAAPESRARRSAAALAAWSDPEIRQRRIDGMRAWHDARKLAKLRPRPKRTRSEAQRVAWRDPDVRPRRSAGIRAAWTRRRDLRLRARADAAVEPSMAAGVNAGAAVQPDPALAGRHLPDGSIRTRSLGATGAAGSSEGARNAVMGERRSR